MKYRIIREEYPDGSFGYYIQERFLLCSWWTNYDTRYVDEGSARAYLNQLNNAKPGRTVIS